MTSLLFGATYLGYKKAVKHKHEKRKQANYERWDSLRDEFEEEEKRRASMQLDLEHPSIPSRNHAWDEGLPENLKVERRSYDSGYDDPRTRRQQLLADPSSPSPVTSTATAIPTRTGSQRRTTSPPPPGGLLRGAGVSDAGSGRSLRSGGSLSQTGQNNGIDGRESSTTRRSASARQSPSPSETARTTTPTRVENIEPEHWHRPGGMMAELLEGGR